MKVFDKKYFRGDTILCSRWAAANKRKLGHKKYICISKEQFKMPKLLFQHTYLSSGFKLEPSKLKNDTLRLSSQNSIYVLQNSNLKVMEPKFHQTLVTPKLEMFLKFRSP